MAAIGLMTALFAPILAPHDPLKTIAPLALPGSVAPDGSHLWLGADFLGRDILSRLIWGTRTVLLWSSLATAASFSVGVTMGLVAGFYGGKLDTALSFIANTLLAFPVTVLYIIIITSFGASGANIVIAVTFASAPGVFRIMRAIALDMRNRDFVAAAITQGENAIAIMAREISAECADAAPCRPVPAPRLYRDHGRCAGLPRARPASADAGLGRHGRRRQEHGDRLPASRDLPLHRHLPPDAGHEPPFRRAAADCQGKFAGMKDAAGAPILRVRDLSVALPKAADRPFAVEDASFDLAEGEIMCVVGESGSGKSVLSSAIMGAAPAGLASPPARSCFAAMTWCA